MAHTTLFAPLGLQIDRGTGTDRWNKWRPTVSLFQHEDFLIDRLELMTQRGADKLTKTIVDDIQSVSPETEVHTHYQFCGPLGLRRGLWNPARFLSSLRLSQI